MLNVQVIGLVYFDGCAVDQKRALVPNGTRGENGIPAHFGSLFVIPDQWVDDDWWSSHRLAHTIAIPTRRGTSNVNVDVIEFRLPEPAELVFPDQNGKAAECVQFSNGLPKLQKLDSHFQLFQKPDTIANFSIRGGTLQACRFDDDSRAVQWTMATGGEAIVIQARTAKETKTIRLKNLEPLPLDQALRMTAGAMGTEVVLSNTPDLLGLHHHVHDEIQHMELFKKIGGPLDLTTSVGPPPPDVPELPTDHPYLNHLKMHEDVPGSGCSPSCCQT